MSEDRQSKLKMYSLGIVTVNKDRGSDLIKVSPTEDLPFLSGNLAQYKTNYQVNSPDSKGVQRSNKLEGEASIVAKWLSFGVSNRNSAPDVRAGETVVLFRFADTDEYYWTTIFREPSVRRQETVLYTYGNLPNGNQAWNKDSSYWFEISTHDKHIQLHTTKSDGEKYEYDIKLDTDNGSLIIADDAGNSISLYSNIGSAEITTTESIKWKSKSVVIEAENLTVNANANISGTLHVSGDISGDASVTVSGLVHGSNI